MQEKYLKAGNFLLPGGLHTRTANCTLFKTVCSDFQVRKYWN